MKIKNLLQSFKYALAGVKYVFINEQNFRLQTFFGFIIIIFSWLFNLRRSEWTVILLLIALVLVLELLNSAIEKFVDVLKPRLSYQIEIVKDIMAAVVLLASLFAVVIGIVIFWPHLLELFSVR